MSATINSVRVIIHIYNAEFVLAFGHCGHHPSNV